MWVNSRKALINLHGRDSKAGKGGGGPTGQWPIGQNGHGRNGAEPLGCGHILPERWVGEAGTGAGGQGAKQAPARTERQGEGVVAGGVARLWVRGGARDCGAAGAYSGRWATAPAAGKGDSSGAAGAKREAEGHRGSDLRGQQAARGAANNSTSSKPLQSMSSNSQRAAAVAK
nr:spidroin-1-like [Aegilops tauschii subsp. strangulata]